MNIIKAHNLTCPIDGNNLEQTEKQLICENGHSYDISRQGYVNLLPVQHKRSKNPGDSKAMVVARTQFLETGIYQTISEHLNKTVLAQIINDKALCILDAGCGEGYYFNNLANFLIQQPQDNKLSFVGLDISKDAIVQANKRSKQISWIVGTNRQPPMRNESVDIILCMFGFLNKEGFNRVLKSGGKIILVDPGPNHLKELREIIYPQLTKTAPTTSKQDEIVGFKLLTNENIRFTKNITDNTNINQLLIMTPHFYRASKQGREVACNLQEINITIDVSFKAFEKH